MTIRIVLLTGLGVLAAAFSSEGVSGLKLNLRSRAPLTGGVLNLVDFANTQSPGPPTPTAAPSGKCLGLLRLSPRWWCQARTHEAPLTKDTKSLRSTPPTTGGAGVLDWVWWLQTRTR